MMSDPLSVAALEAALRRLSMRAMRFELRGDVERAERAWRAAWRRERALYRRTVAAKRAA